jgi:hypothetical protein
MGKVRVLFATPQPGSFAIKAKVTTVDGKQLQLFDTGEQQEDVISAKELIDEVFTCVQLFNESKDEELKERITDETYFNNFVALTQKIASDGRTIGTVGLATLDANNPKGILIKKRSNPPILSDNKINNKNQDSDAPIEFTGELRFADSKTSQGDAGEIKIHTKDGQIIKLIVSRGMMSDIVKPYYEEEVRVKAQPFKKKYKLLEIEPV